MPTTYYSAATQALADAGISMAIWANHLLRASITAMQDTAATLYQDQSLLAVEHEIAPVKEIFRLQDADELKVAERQYLPQKNGSSF